MYVVIPITSKCGNRFEAHVVPSRETHGGHLTACPDCGERLALPYRLLRPLIRLK
jgi:DNA-directed RNA polymerase subunit RPC12/RpoP